MSINTLSTLSTLLLYFSPDAHTRINTRAHVRGEYEISVESVEDVETGVMTWAS
jgi:hypothetical protein